jgi:hypothetical protein
MAQGSRSIGIFLALFAAGTGTVVTSCKKAMPYGNTVTGGETGAARSELLADSRREINSSSNFFFAVWDDTFTARLADLPASGGAPEERIPYSGHWYPEVNGGTNVFGALTKYDRAFNGGRPLASNWESANHSLRRTDTGANWAGHCNGFSAASSRHKEPARAVARNGIVFEAQDIKALLAEVYMSAKYYFLGGNRCEQDRVRRPTERPDPTTMNECDDVNPGTFHVAIANWIGRKGYPVVTDMTVSSQVWNYPAYKYAAQVQRISRQTALQYIGAGGSNYVFNPAAEQFAFVNMTLNYAKALPGEPQGNVAPTRELGTKQLQYVLELSGSDEVIGGEWLGQSQTDHPDFIWLALEAMQGSGTKYFGNPNVDVNAIISMWAESVGLDPANPPPGLREPAWIKDWGKFPTFEVVLDDNQTGAVFMGREVTLRLKRRGPLQGAVELAVSVNGSQPLNLKPTGNDDVTMRIRPVPGANRIDVVWRKGGLSFEERSLRFHAMN